MNIFVRKSVILVNFPLPMTQLLRTIWEMEVILMAITIRVIIGVIIIIRVIIISVIIRVIIIIMTINV